VVVGDLVAGLWLVLGVAVLCLAFGGLFAGVTALAARLRAPRSRALGLAVLALLLAATLGAVLVLPAVAAVLGLLTLVWAVAAVVPGGGRLRVQMAARSLDRRRTRTAVTLVAFLAGVFAMSLTLTLAGGLRDQLTTALASAGTTNLIAVGSQPTRDLLIRESGGLPGLQSRVVTTTASGAPTAISGRSLGQIVLRQPGADPEESPLRGINGVTGYDLASGARPAALVARRGRLLRPADAGTSNVVVDNRFAGRPLLLHPGSTITLSSSSGGDPVTVNVVGLYGRTGARGAFDRLGGPRIFGDTSLADRLGAGDSQTIVSMAVGSGALVHDSVLLQHAVPGALVLNVNDLTAVVRTVLNNLITVLAVVTGLTLVAGITVIGNGVTLAMIERRREIAVMKAIGYSPRSVVAMVLLENAFSGLLAGSVSVVLVAVGLALLSHYTLITAITFSPGLATLVLFVAAAVAVVTAALASRRAVALRPTEVLRDA
ncbi:MAG: ABC transporter permease, partial [Candidatus Dormibacteraeota bacterium]|nr:ABC transporter permease [Candidatus Dormibacteraeota bacterium]